MKFSICVAVHNEGIYLEGMLALILASDPKPHEVIIVDDHSEPPLLPRLDWFIERAGELDITAKVIRPPEQLGAGMAKRRAADESTGDVIVLLDAHMRMAENWLAFPEKAMAAFPEAIMCACCRGFKMESPFFGAGARFVRKPPSAGPRRFFMPQLWLPRGPLEAIDTVPSILGACYMIPRHIWDDLGGMNPNFYGWGYEEHDLSMRAWMYGYEVRRINAMVVLHRFGDPNPGNRMNSWQPPFNAMVCAATLFEDGVYENVYEPLFKDVCARPAAHERFELVRSEIDAFRREVQDRRTITDDELYKLTDYRHPTEAEANNIRRLVANEQHSRSAEERKPRRDSLGFRPLRVGAVMERHQPPAENAAK